MEQKAKDQRCGFFITNKQMETLEKDKSKVQSKTKYIEGILQDITKGNYDFLLQSRPDYDKRVTADKEITREARTYLKDLGYSVPDALRTILNSKHQSKEYDLIYGSKDNLMKYYEKEGAYKTMNALYHSYIVLNAKYIDLYEYGLDVMRNEDVLEFHRIVERFYEHSIKAIHKGLRILETDFKKYQQMIANTLSFQHNLNMKFNKGYSFD